MWMLGYEGPPTELKG